MDYELNSYVLHIGCEEEILIKIRELNTDKFSIFIPCGEEEKELKVTDNVHKNKIELKVGKDWSINQEENENGIKFTVTRENEPIIGFMNSYVILKGICAVEFGICYIVIDSGEEKREIWLKKEEPALKILLFEPQTGTVKKGEKAVLVWETVGAEKCIIYPQCIEVEPNGKFETEILDTTQFYLEAYANGKQVEKSTFVYIYESEFEEYFIAQPDTYYKGSYTKVSCMIKNWDIGSKLSIEAFSELTLTKEKVKLDGSTLKAECHVLASPKITFRYLKGGKEQTRILNLKPDSEQVILRFVVSKIVNEIKNSDSSLNFAIGWNTYGAEEIKIFVRILKPKDNSDNNVIQRFQSYFISQNEKSGKIVFKLNSTEESTHLFFLRAKNKFGVWKEAVIVYKDGKELEQHDNLQ